LGADRRGRRRGPSLPARSARVLPDRAHLVLARTIEKIPEARLTSGALHILIAAVGKSKAGPERALYETYIARLPWRIELKEIEIKKELAADVRKAREGEALLAAIPSGARIVVLDERGRTESSEALAARLGRWRDEGVRTIGFIIGGADGLDEAVRKKADIVLSFGALTWPHMLVRAMLAEQIYRAQSILAGHPYHRA